MAILVWWTRRVDPAALPPRLPLTAPSTADVAYPWDTSDSLLFRVGMSWAKQGRVILADNRLTFPVAQQVPGLYPFRIRGSAGEVICIGESENLARRFRLYSSPGPPNRQIFDSMRSSAMLCQNAQRLAWQSLPRRLESMSGALRKLPTSPLKQCAGCLRALPSSKTWATR
jgi:hypothetical protein